MVAAVHGLWLSGAHMTTPRLGNAIVAHSIASILETYDIDGGIDKETADFLRRRFDELKARVEIVLCANYKPKPVISRGGTF